MAQLVRDFCDQCNEIQIGANNGECPVCGSALQRRGTHAQIVEVEQTSIFERIEQFFGEEEAFGENAPQNLKGASDEAIASLQKFTIGDLRCSVLHEVVIEICNNIELTTSEAAVSPIDKSSITNTSSKRTFLETQIAAFSNIPSPTSSPVDMIFGNPIEGDREFDNISEIEGSIVVLKRGKISFANKAIQAQKAGALAVVIIQTVDIWPYTMLDSKNEAKGNNISQTVLTIPVVMIKKEDGEMLQHHCLNSSSSHESTQSQKAQLHVHDIDTQCPICQEEYMVDTQALRFPCRHHFHESCILGWLKKHNTCPICRYELEDRSGCFERSTDRVRDETYLSWFC